MEPRKSFYMEKGKHTADVQFANCQFIIDWSKEYIYKYLLYVF